MRFPVALACFLGVLVGLRAQGNLPGNLPRHGVIGLVAGPADSTRPAGPANPVTVERVLEGGAGDAAGFQTGDEIVSVDGQPVERVDQFVRAIGRHLAGQAVAVAVRHGGPPEVRTAALKPRPFETSPGAEVLYHSVTVRGLGRRTIVTRPHREGRLPAVLLVGGLGCYSLDGTDRTSGYGRILSAFEEKGFVTMRVEKTGEGDSQGPPCTDLSVTPDVEAEGYLAGLRALKSYDFVDRTRVFVFAHSLGPVIASLAIAEEPVRGFMAVETVGKTWLEYDIERVRVQAALSGALPDQVDETVRHYEPCSHRFFVGKEKPEELLRTPECQAVLAPLAGVPYTYMQAVEEINLGRQWKFADFPVLVVYGTASPVTTAAQNQYLAELINRFHPHRATYVEVPGMGHDFNRYESQKEYHESYGAPGHTFHSGLLDVLMTWVDGVLQEPR
jgi:uncharacterized protein